jgi:PHD/YefM family antitoxin component YafN of YafNO toxin-antitoxin module
MGTVIDRAMAHPVTITRYRRACVVMLNVEEYDRLVSRDTELTKLQEDKGS